MILLGIMQLTLGLISIISSYNFANFVSSDSLTSLTVTPTSQSCDLIARLWM